jgi:hypothetical protein
VALEGRQWEEHKFLSGFSRSKTCVTSLEDAECLGHPSVGKTDESVYQVKECNLKNRRITICEVANMSGISFGSVQSNLQHVPGPSKES